jgi:sugar phosphate isomerase/epimerase
VKSWWLEQGIQITGMQSLLFGTNGLNVFGNLDVREKMLAHLSVVCSVAEGLGVSKLVFGSPKNRDVKGLSSNAVNEISYDFFNKLGDIAKSHSINMCLEPNPEIYGANFMTNSEDTAIVVESVAHSHIKMQLDTGALAVNNEDVEQVLSRYSHLVGHIHISEPNLVPVSKAHLQHIRNAESIKHHLPDYICAIEMLTNKVDEPLIALGNSVKYIQSVYGKLS